MRVKLFKIVFKVLLIILIQLIIISCGSKTKEDKTLRTDSTQVSSSDTVQSSRDTIRFDFEQGVMEWKSKNWRDFRGSTGVEARNEYSKSGIYSLKLDCNINPDKEAFVDLRDACGGPMNFEGKTIRCWVLAISPSDTGTYKTPDGVQLFVRSVNNEGKPNEEWASCYSEWYPLSERVGEWFEISLMPTGIGKMTKKNLIEKKFDPKKVAVIGIKVSGKKGKKSTFNGLIYIDDISW